MFPKTISAFNKYSDVLESILQSTINSDASFLGGHKKSIYCRVKSTFTSQGEPVADTYGRDIEMTLLVAVDVAEPEIGMKSRITVQVGGNNKSFDLEVDQLVLDEFKKHFDESTIEERLKKIAQANLELDISQSLPVDRLRKIVIAKRPLPESIDIGGRNISDVFTDAVDGQTTASITIEICYEEEGNQRTWCYDYTFGTEMA